MFSIGSRLRRFSALLTGAVAQQPVWKDVLLAALAKSHPGVVTTSMGGMPANLDLTAFAEAVHAHVVGGVSQTSMPAAKPVRASPHASSPAHQAANRPSIPPPHLHHTPSNQGSDDNHQDLPDMPTPALSPPSSPAPQQPTHASICRAQDYAIVPPTQPGGTLQLTAQDNDIRATVRQAIADLDIWLSFDNSFPDALTRTRKIANLLSQAACALEYVCLEERLLADQDFTRSLSGLVRRFILDFTLFPFETPSYPGVATASVTVLTSAF